MATAASREERRQMRLRGAANRKVKDINFGFTFGSPGFQSQPSPPPPPQPVPVLTPSAKPAKSPSQHAPSPNSQLSIPSRASSRRARLSLPTDNPEQESVYEIPPDDDPETTSVVKRRRIRKFSTVQGDVPESSPTVRRAASDMLQAFKSKIAASPNGIHPPATQNNVASSDVPDALPNGSEIALRSPPIDQNSTTPKPAPVRKHGQKPKRKRRHSVRVLPKKKRKSIPNAPVQPPASEPMETRDDPPQDIFEHHGNNAQRQKDQSPTPVPSLITNGESEDIPEIANSGEDQAQQYSKQSSEPASPPAVQLLTPAAEENQAQNSPEAQSLPSRYHSPLQGTSISPSSQPKRGRKKATRKPTEQQTESRERKANKKREPRSTVPVTVQRLANISALQEDPDTTAPLQEISIPSRGGVNAADVLSQICRETLDKTVSTLQSAIERESNRARRAEWNWKRKAVEAFGSELEGRLFSMSELLDSNFVLNVGLKKAKKDRSALSNELLDIRREREEVAIRMEEVRKRFSEDEDAKVEHGTINNALHDLQLAVDRSQKNAGQHSKEDPPNPFVGLEYLLRTVSQDVSSAAPNSRGGLLEQVQAFNGRLQRTIEFLDGQR
ncbi:hypothetical protein FQN57_005307 [Myotisia sp. PD_48]|nr:hypothetical protein FQN57_005307 [Myotisia sp. PD_48]